MSAAQRVLGVDPGTRRLGWGIVERRGAKVLAVAAGVVKLSEREALETRLDKVHRALGEIIDTYAPSALAVEDIFYAEFPAAAIKLGHVRGVVLLVGAQRALEVASYPPALVKRTIAGRGAADKAQIGRLVAATLGLRAAPPVDAADALAVALAHCSKARLRGGGALDKR
ncbi:MAG: crossover junction endodeoxyribonuclease RuvC [Sandaracinaceae bacterium]|nr:crossover junction endodeoxyribonuclease RuvC [Sandaracinaceae bacterium]